MLKGNVGTISIRIKIFTWSTMKFNILKIMLIIKLQNLILFFFTFLSQGMSREGGG